MSAWLLSRVRRCGVYPTLARATVCAFLAITSEAHAQHVADVRPSLVLDRVTVIDVEHGRRLTDQRVVIIGHRITQIGLARSVVIPRGAQVIDARGKFLIPGLWDMHIHPMAETAVFYPLLIANGVTGIRDAWSPVPLQTLLQGRQEILAGTRVGPPRALFVGPALDEENPCVRTASMVGHVCVGDSTDARHVVDSLRAAGADMIKMYFLSRRMYFVIAAEARRLGVPFGGHLGLTAVERLTGGMNISGLGGGLSHIGDALTSSIAASDSGASIVDHVETVGDILDRCVQRSGSVSQCQVVADHFRRNGTWWCPTLTAFDDPKSFAWADDNGVMDRRLLGSVSRRLMTRAMQAGSAFWAGVPKTGPWLRDSNGVPVVADTDGVLRRAESVGLPILAGTDDTLKRAQRVPPGFDLHLELAFLVAEGITPLEALQAATLNPAKLLHATDSLGTAAPGKLADLVLLDADPLKDITNTTAIRAVVANGRYFDRAALDQLLAESRAAAGRKTDTTRANDTSPDSTLPTPRLTVRPREMATGTRTDQAGALLLDSATGTWLYIPKQCVGTRRVPLVVLLGGGGWTGENIMKLERREADRYGMIVLAPNAVAAPGMWDIFVDRTGFPRMPQRTTPLYPTDLKAIDAAMQKVLRRFAIDPTKIALVGYSNGGSYALFVGRYNVDVFSRVAALSAVFPLGEGTSPPRTTTQFLLSGGIAEQPGGAMILQTMQLAHALRDNGHIVEVLLGLREHEPYEPDFGYMWSWLGRTWRSSPTVQSLSGVSADSDPMLTVDALTRMTTFWNNFMKEPDSILTAGRMNNQEYITLSLGERQVSVIKTNMIALAAQYPSVASDLAAAGLTPQLEERYRAAIIRVGLTRSSGAEVGIVSPTSVLGMNSAFRSAHDQEFRALGATKMWITQ